MSFTPHQRGIINRYYEHADTRTLAKLQESVSDLYLADAKAADKLWKSVEALLAKTMAADAGAREIVQRRDIKGLAEVVGRLSAPGAAVTKPRASGRSG